MRRKGSRNASKATEKNRSDSPKRLQSRSSRRRKRSASSGEESEQELQETAESNKTMKNATGEGRSDNDNDREETVESHTPESSKNIQNRSTFNDQNIDSNKKNSSDNTTLDGNLQDDISEREEEQEENKIKGKSKSKGISNIETSSNIVEPETEPENVQVTPQSPSNDNADNENVQNVTESQSYTETEDRRIEEDSHSAGNTSIKSQLESDNLEKIIETNEGDKEKEVNKNTENTSVETRDSEIVNGPNSNEKGNITFSEQSSNNELSVSEKQSDINEDSLKKERNVKEKAEKLEDKSKRISLRRSSPKESSEDYDRKDKNSNSKKKITLKRPQEYNKDSSVQDDKESSETNWSSKYEQDKEKVEGRKDVSVSRKISLKRRPTSDERLNLDKASNEKSQHHLSRSTSVGGESSRDIKRRLSTTSEKSLTDTTEKLQKPSKRVKLNRNFEEQTEHVPEEGNVSERKQKTNWTNSQWISDLKYSVNKVDVDLLKTICPNLELIPESEVKLETVMKERRKSESEKRSFSRKTSADTEDESDKTEDEKQNSEDSASEQSKIEQNQNIIAMNRKISIVDDTASKLRPPPSPAKNSLSEVLFITNLVRPFTVKQLKELLERTGKIKEDGFWTDRIKSKCYVHYESTEEAEATRNALHGVNWPIGNGKKLVIDYATVEDLVKAKNPPPPPAPPPKEKTPEIEMKKPERHVTKEREKEERKRSERQVREWDLGKEDIHRRRSRTPPSRSRERAKKHNRRSFTPEDYHNRKRKHEDNVSQKLMDDLFLKTKATPSIYWQPLSPTEIAMKQQQRLVRMEEHKRRLEENRGSGRREAGRGTTFRRR